MIIPKRKQKEINELFKKEKGAHFSEAFKRCQPPYKTTDLEWYRKEQKKKYGV